MMSVPLRIIVKRVLKKYGSPLTNRRKQPKKFWSRQT